MTAVLLRHRLAPMPTARRRRACNLHGSAATASTASAPPSGRNAAATRIGRAAADSDTPSNPNQSFRLDGCPSAVSPPAS